MLWASSAILLSVRPSSSTVRGCVGLSRIAAMSRSRSCGRSADNSICLLRAIEDQLSKRLIEVDGTLVGPHAVRRRSLVDLSVENRAPPNRLEEASADQSGELLCLRQIPPVVHVLRGEARRENAQDLQRRIQPHANVSYDLQQANNTVRGEAVRRHGNEHASRCGQCVYRQHVQPWWTIYEYIVI